MRAEKRARLHSMPSLYVCLFIAVTSVLHQLLSEVMLAVVNPVITAHS